MRFWALPAVALAGLVAGCASFYPVETTPEGITTTLAPGDTVRLTTRDGTEWDLLVLSVNDEEIKGRTEHPLEVVRVRYDRIEVLEIQRLNMKKAVLATVLPALIAAAIACNNRDCDTHAVLTATY